MRTYLYVTTKYLEDSIKCKLNERGLENAQYYIKSGRIVHIANLVTDDPVLKFDIELIEGYFLKQQIKYDKTNPLFSFDIENVADILTIAGICTNELNWCEMEWLESFGSESLNSYKEYVIDEKIRLFYFIIDAYYK